MAGTTGLEPATSAVTGQRSNQLSYVPGLFFNNLVICHIDSSVSKLSLFSLVSTISLSWTQFSAFLDTKWTPSGHQKSRHNDRLKSIRCAELFEDHFPSNSARPRLQGRAKDSP